MARTAGSSSAHITLPSLRPILLLVVTLQIIASFQLVGQPQIMTGGGPPARSAARRAPVLLHIYQTGFDGTTRAQLRRRHGAHRRRDDDRRQRHQLPACSAPSGHRRRDGHRARTRPRSRPADELTVVGRRRRRQGGRIVLHRGPHRHRRLLHAAAAPRAVDLAQVPGARSSRTPGFIPRGPGPRELRGAVRRTAEFGRWFLNSAIVRHRRHRSDRCRRRRSPPTRSHGSTSRARASCSACSSRRSSCRA